MSINEIQNKIIDEFSMFEDWMDKYNLLIDIGKDLPVIDPRYKVKDFLIEGCQSKVWLHPDYNGQRCHHHKRHSCPSYTCSVRPYSGRDIICRSVFHRQDRTAAESFTYPFKRTAFDGAPDKTLCNGIQCDKKIIHL